MSIDIDSTKGITGLKGALRYVRAYRDHVFVVKLGGEVLADRHQLDQVAEQLALLASLSIRLVVVHGGGPQASALSRRLGLEPVMIAGRRVTDDSALEVVTMVYRGLLNTELVSALHRAGVQATGLSGVDAELLTARRRPPVMVTDDAGVQRLVDYGHVGDIDVVDPRVLRTLMEARFVPVVSSLAGDREGNVYNVNADTVAESMAIALQAQKLIFLTGAGGRAARPERSVDAGHVRRSGRPRGADGERSPCGRDAAQGGSVHPRGDGRGGAHAHHRRPGAGCAAARGVHRLGLRHHDRRTEGEGDLSRRRPGRLKSRSSANWSRSRRSAATRDRPPRWSSCGRGSSDSTSVRDETSVRSSVGDEHAGPTLVLASHLDVVPPG